MAQSGAIAVNRLFTFGCSFTTYAWSTWADILAPKFDYFQNWAKSGGGNHFIFNSVFECDQRNHFQPDDTVIVCWSNTHREDRYTGKQWLTPGNIYTQDLYKKDWIKDFVDDRGMLVRDIAYIKAVKNLLESKQVNWRFLSMVPINQADQYNAIATDQNQDIIDLYQDVIKTIAPSFWEILKDRPRSQIDLHPLPADHLYYVDQVLTEFTVSEQTRQAILDEDRAIRSAGAIPPYNRPKINRL